MAVDLDEDFKRRHNISRGYEGLQGTVHFRGTCWKLVNCWIRKWSLTRQGNTLGNDRAWMPLWEGGSRRGNGTERSEPDGACSWYLSPPKYSMSLWFFLMMIFCICVYCKIISTISLVDIHHRTVTNILFSWWKLLRFTLSNSKYTIQYC